MAAIAKTTFYACHLSSSLAGLAPLILESQWRIPQELMHMTYSVHHDRILSGRKGCRTNDENSGRKVKRHFQLVNCLSTALLSSSSVAYLTSLLHASAWPLNNNIVAPVSAGLVAGATFVLLFSTFFSQFVWHYMLAMKVNRKLLVVAVAAGAAAVALGLFIFTLQGIILQTW